MPTFVLGGPNIVFELTLNKTARDITISGTRSMLLSVMVALANALNEQRQVDIELRDGLFLDVYLLSDESADRPVPMQGLSNLLRTAPEPTIEGNDDTDDAIRKLEAQVAHMQGLLDGRARIITNQQDELRYIRQGLETMRLNERQLGPQGRAGIIANLLDHIQLALYA